MAPGIIPLAISGNPIPMIPISPAFPPVRMASAPSPLQYQPPPTIPNQPTGQPLFIDLADEPEAIQPPVAPPAPVFSACDVQDPAFAKMLPPLPVLPPMHPPAFVPPPRMPGNPPRNAYALPGQASLPNLGQQPTQLSHPAPGRQSVPTYGAPPRDQQLYRDPKHHAAHSHHGGSLQSLGSSCPTFHSGPLTQTSPPPPPLKDQLSRQQWDDKLNKHPFGENSYSYSASQIQRMQADRKAAEVRSQPSPGSSGGIRPLNASIVENPRYLADTGNMGRASRESPGRKRTSSQITHGQRAQRKTPQPEHVQPPPQPANTTIERITAPSGYRWTTYTMQKKVNTGKIQCGGWSLLYFDLQYTAYAESDS